jgi:hypothetical protein
MLSTNTQWILWAIAMLVFLGLTLSGHTAALGLTIMAVAVVWYTFVPSAGPKDNRYRR